MTGVLTGISHRNPVLVSASGNSNFDDSGNPGAGGVVLERTATDRPGRSVAATCVTCLGIEHQVISSIN